MPLKTSQGVFLNRGSQPKANDPKLYMFCVYVLEMQDGRLYIGQTENLEKRIFDHHNEDGAKFTKGKVFNLVGSIVVDSRSSALILEKKLKAFKNPFRVKEYLRGCSPD